MKPFNFIFFFDQLDSGLDFWIIQLKTKQEKALRGYFSNCTSLLYRGAIAGSGMLEEERKKTCLQIGNGYLVLKLIRSQLSIDFSLLEAFSQVYGVILVQSLPENLKSLFLSCEHLYKYLSDYPARIIDLTPNAMEVFFERGDKTEFFTIKFERLYEQEDEKLQKRKLFILGEQIRLKRIQQNAVLRNLNQINEQMILIFVEAQSNYHEGLRALQALKEKVIKKRVEKALMKRRTQQKEQKLIDLKEKQGNCIALDD